MIPFITRPCSVAILSLIFLAGTLSAQTLTVLVADRAITNRATAQDGVSTPYDSGGQNFADVLTNGIFDHSVDDKGSTVLASVDSSISQSSTVESSPTALNVFCMMGSTNTNVGFSDSSGHYAIVNSSPQASLRMDFLTDQPFQFSLAATTSRRVAGSQNPAGLPDALAQLYSADTNYGSYGGSAAAGTFAQTGTSRGTLPPGHYSLTATVNNSAQWNVNGLDDVGFNYTGTALISLTLSVNAMPPAAPGNLKLKALGGDIYQLTWESHAAGNYSVSVSTNLTDWVGYLPVEMHGAGPQTNFIGALPGAAQAYYRVQYLP